MEIPDELIQSLLPAIEQQLDSPQTAYVRKAYDRLAKLPEFKDDHSAVLDLLAQALAIAVNRMMTSGKPFDTAYYRKVLDQLPEFPSE